MNRRNFLKSLASIPFLGFLKPEIPLTRLDLIAEGMEVNELLEATKPVVKKNGEKVNVWRLFRLSH